MARDVQMSAVAGEPNPPFPAKRRVTLVGHAADATLNFRAPLIADLLAAGCEVEVLAPDWTPQQLRRLQILGAQGATYPLMRTGLNPLQDIRTAGALYRHLRRTRPDAVLTFAAKTNVWGMLAAAAAGVPRRGAMVAGLGYAFIEGGSSLRDLKRRLLRFILSSLFRGAFRFANFVVVQNPDDGHFVNINLGVKKEKIVRINGTGVPLDDWPLHPPHLEPVTFTLVARLLREKGVLEFLAAARQIKAEYPHTRFWLLGPLDENPGGLKREEIEPWVRDGIVEWPGAVDVKPWLAQTSVFVLPSYREGVPRSTQEAMAMGRPVITTDAPGCRETVVEGVNGCLVPPRDVAALVAAMRRFIQNPQLVETMGRESRRLAEERFDVRRANAVLMGALGVNRSPQQKMR